MRSLITLLEGCISLVMEEYPRKYDQRRPTTQPSHSPCSGILHGLYLIYKRESDKVLKIQRIATPDMLKEIFSRNPLGLLKHFDYHFVAVNSEVLSQKSDLHL